MGRKKGFTGRTPHFEVYRHQSMELSVIEQEVEVVVLVIDRDPFLPGHECEAGA
jgi:hypothetical protein